MSTNATFRFLDLPLEIRYIIYEMRLVHRRGIINLFRWENQYCHESPPALGINLLRTCHQVHDEAINVLYAQNTFCILPLISFLKHPRMGECSCQVAGYDRKGEFKSKAFTVMSQQNRDRIKKLEVLLPLPKDICHTHLKPTRSFFPHLNTVTFLLTPMKAGLVLSQFGGKNGKTVWDEYVKKYARILPVAKHIHMDFTRSIRDQPFPSNEYHQVLVDAFESYSPTIKQSNFHTQFRIILALHDESMRLLLQRFRKCQIEAITTRPAILLHPDDFFRTRRSIEGIEFEDESEEEFFAIHHGHLETLSEWRKNPKNKVYLNSIRSKEAMLKPSVV